MFSYWLWALVITMECNRTVLERISTFVFEKYFVDCIEYFDKMSVKARVCSECGFERSYKCFENLSIPYEFDLIIEND